MSLQDGCLVTYGSTGLCRVEGQKDLRFGESRRRYFILTPCSSQSSTIYVPTDNPALVDKIKPLLTEEEIRSIVRDLPPKESLWNENASVRKKHFREILDKGDRRELIQLIGTLYQEKQQREAQGKKLWVFDEQILNTARNTIYEEFAFVLKIHKDEVEDWIASRKKEEDQYG